MAYMTDATLTGRRLSPLAAVGGLFRTVAVWAAVARERRALRDMGWSRLDDLGLTANDAGREARKPFWRTRRAA